jgi:hypothetical protein
MRASRRSCSVTRSAEQPSACYHEQVAAGTRLVILSIIVLAAVATIGALLATEGSGGGTSGHGAPAPKELAVIRRTVLRVAAGAGEHHPFGGRLYRTTVQAAVRATENGAAINPRGFPRYIYLAVIHGTFKVDVSTPARVRSAAAKWPPTFKVALIQIDPKTGRAAGSSWSDKLPDLSSLGFWIDPRLPS